MKKVKRWRYYCEYCRKSGCSGGHIARHERGCTANPNRECAMHGFVTTESAPDMPALLAAIEHDAKLTKLRAVAHNCPACILAALRQSNVMMVDGEGMPFAPDFDFRAEREAIFAAHNAAEYEREGMYY
ncbi:MAG: hypothetical protein ACM31O_14475 [Bacteroidota bacterium]